MNRFPARRTAMVGGLAASILAGGAALAATGSNGQALSLYQNAQRAVARYQGVSFKGGVWSYRVFRASGGYDTFRYDFGAVPKHYRAASDHVLVVLRDGTVAEETDTLSAKGLPNAEIWINNAHNEIGEVLNKGLRCALFFTSANGFTAIGQPFQFGSGLTFAKPSGSKGHWLLSSTYPLAGGKVRELDTISASSGLWQASRSSVKGGSYNGYRATASSFHYDRHHGIPTPPQLGRC
jgi:hypothetical protein